MGVHLLESYDTRLREGVRAWAEQTATSDICVTLQTKAAHVPDLLPEIIICFGKEFFLLFFGGGGEEARSICQS